MKTVRYITFIIVSLFIFSCEYDNYGAPSETLQGKIIDKATGLPIQTEQGNGIRMQLDELSWSDNPTPLYFWVKQDGTYQNTKLFKGNYRISPIDGPFVPVLIRDGSGNIVADGRKTVDVSGKTTVDFEVEPFLTVTWIKQPYIDASGYIAADIKIERGTSNTSYHFNVTDVYLFIAPNTYVGNANYDGKYSSQIVYDGTNGNAQLGETITIRSKEPLPSNRDFYVRVGARTSDNVQKRYNYTDIQKVTIP
ncbi:MAG: DUF3823 domain-containing protein [Bacteroides sp.]|nr:DUF3823 domain-containing protein [Bacteroides sp.]